jgi:hypothetical protein
VHIRLAGYADFHLATGGSDKWDKLFITLLHRPLTEKLG